MINVLTNVVLVLHILIAIALTGAVLLQRSEGGALGMGGGGAGGGLMSGRGAAGALVRTTMFLAIGFFVTSLALTTIANRTNTAASAVESEVGETGPSLDENEPLSILSPTATPQDNEEDEDAAPGDLDLDEEEPTTPQ